MSLAEQAAQSGLARVGARPPLKHYLVEVWQRRQFIYLLARYRIEADNQRNTFGMGWVLLTPLLNAVIYGLIFGVLLAGSRPPNFVCFLIIGVFLFQFFQGSFTSGAKAITSNTALVQSLNFPRISLPLSAVMQRFLAFLPTLGIMAVIVMLTGERPQWQWLGMAPLVVLFFFFNAGLAMFTARLTVHFRDLNEFLPIITRLIFYTTGIFYSFDVRFKDHPTVLRIVDFQPIHEFLALGRALMLSGPGYDVKEIYWLYATVWSIAIFAAGVTFFWAAEERYGRVD